MNVTLRVVVMLAMLGSGRQNLVRYITYRVDMKTLPTALRLSANGTRYFCRACGTHVACINAEHAEVVDVAVGSIDCPEPFIPTLQIFEDTRLSWLASGHDG